MDEQQQNACCKRKQERVDPAHLYRPVTTLNMPIANPSTIAVAMTIPALFPMMSISSAPFGAPRRVRLLESTVSGRGERVNRVPSPHAHPVARTGRSPALTA